MGKRVYLGGAKLMPTLMEDYKTTGGLGLRFSSFLPPLDVFEEFQHCFFLNFAL